MASTFQPFHRPQTKGKFKRHHRSVNERTALVVCEMAGEPGVEIARPVEYYNPQRYQEALGIVTPDDACFGRRDEVRAKFASADGRLTTSGARIRLRRFCASSAVRS